MAKTYTQRLQACIDNPVKQIKKFRRWKDKSLQGLSPDFQYKQGLADAFSIKGTVQDPEVINERVPVSLLYHHPSHTRAIWQRTEDDCASILVVDRPKHKQGNPYKLLPCLDKAFDLIFNQQNYKAIYSRASQPITDVGCRGKDWRMDLVAWKTRRNSVRPVMIPRLQALWLKLCRYSIPAQSLSEEYPSESIMILSPNELKKLNKESLQELDDVHGDARRKWRFTDLSK